MVGTVSPGVALFDGVLITLFVDESNRIFFIIEIVFLMPIAYQSSSAGDQIDAQECQDAATDKFANTISGCRLEVTI